MRISARHTEWTHIGGLVIAVLDERTDKEMRSVFDPLMVREASRQSCDQSCIAQSAIFSKAEQLQSTSALLSMTPIFSVA